MSYKFFANNRSVCTKGTPDAAYSDQDFCFDDKMTTPVPLANVALTKNLGVGKTTKTFADGFPIWTANGELDADTLYPLPGFGVGEISTTYLDKCIPLSYSPDVIVEGGGVVRMSDATLQNDSNCIGEVIPAGLAAALAAPLNAEAMVALALERAAREEARRRAEEARKAAEEAARKEEERLQELEDNQDKLCAIESATITDADGRSAKPGGTLATVRSGGSETITCEGELVGECLSEPEWVVSGYNSHQATGTTTTFGADAWFLGESWLGGIGSRSSNVVFRSTVDEKSFTLKQYPADKYTLQVEAPPALINLLAAVSSIIGKIAESPKLDGPTGAVSVQAGWEEDSNPAICFYGFTITGGFSPLLEAKTKIPLSPVAIPAILAQYIGAANAGIFLTLNGSLALEVNLSRTGVSSFSGGGEVSGAVSLTLSFDIKLFSKDVIDLSIGVTGTIKGSGSVTGGGPAGRAQWSVSVKSSLSGFIKISALGGFIEVKRDATFLESGDGLTRTGTFPPT